MKGAVLVTIASLAAFAAMPSAARLAERRACANDGSYGVTDDIQRRIDAASAAGGGTVTLEAGDYPVAGIFLKNGVLVEQGDVEEMREVRGVSMADRYREVYGHQEVSHA